MTKSANSEPRLGGLRTFSGIQPSGSVHLGNYLGAIRQYVDTQNSEAFYCVVDLHALTSGKVPGLKERTYDTLSILLAAGLDPEVCCLFVQSQVPYHTQLGYLLECVAGFGELSRMTQFKEKSVGGEARVGLFTYPVLMAADILLYETSVVPVGDDQRQHMVLAREIARRFNGLYGDIFVVPEMVKTTLGDRVMDLQSPLNKMSKSVKSPGTVLVLDNAAVIKRKVMRAATDSESGVAYDKEARPGLANLLEIYGALSGESVHQVAQRYSNYRDLKGDLGDLICATLVPIAERYGDIRADVGGLEEIMSAGAVKAASVSGPVYERAAGAIGLA